MMINDDELVNIVVSHWTNFLRSDRRGLLVAIL